MISSEVLELFKGTWNDYERRLKDLEKRLDSYLSKEENGAQELEAFSEGFKQSLQQALRDLETAQARTFQDWETRLTALEQQATESEADLQQFKNNIVKQINEVLNTTTKKTQASLDAITASHESLMQSNSALSAKLDKLISS